MILDQHLYAITAGEISGDTLGAGLIEAIKRLDPKARFIGIGGPRMIRAGMQSSFDIQALSVMGISEVLSHLVPILRIRRKIGNIIIEKCPCILIGIDSPDFNLTLERRVHAAGIPTVHYVSPSVWAWREGRMKKIKASCDEVLCLLKFEKDYYDEHDMPATYVGHTLANVIPLDSDQNLARERIDLYRTCVENVKGKIMGILPGSRRGVIEHMLPVYAQAARLVKKEMPDTVFITTVPNYELACLVKDLWLEHSPDLSLTVYVGSTRDVIASCDALLLTSGTVALETMLVNRPFCVAYKVSPLTAAIGRRMLRISTYSLPNLIARTTLVRELIQEQCTPEALCHEMLQLLRSDNLVMRGQFRTLHEQMRMPSDALAAAAVMRIAGHKEDFQESSEHSFASGDMSVVNEDEVEPELTLPDGEDLSELDLKSEPKFGSESENIIANVDEEERIR